MSFGASGSGFSRPRPPQGGAARPAPGSSKGARIVVTVVVALVVVATLFVIFTNFWTDFLWFGSLSAEQVFTTELTTKILLFVIFGVFTAVFVWFMLWLAYRLAPPFTVQSMQQLNLERYRTAFEPFRKWVFLAGPALLGLFAGVSAAGSWQTWLMWRNGQEFGQADPEFGMDIGFYIFDYPFLRFLTDFGFSTLILGLVAAAIVHYLYGGLQFGGTGNKITRAAKAHLAVLIGFLLLLKAFAYWLDRFGLLLEESSLITGAQYTSVNALLPAKNILLVIALVIAVLFFASAFLRGWMLPVLGVGLLILSVGIIGLAYPAFVQRFQVQASESEKEAPYLERNINATRSAYGVADTIVSDYAAELTPDDAVVQQDTSTLANIRIVDPAVVSDTYKQLQQFRSFYEFPRQLNVDRYDVNGNTRGAVIAARELNLENLPADRRNWTNDHTVYTHGYGVVSAFDNVTTFDGKPLFMMSGIPQQGQPKLEQPRIYYGETSPDYSIVGAPEGSKPHELDYPEEARSESNQVNNTYDGEGGVPVGNFFNKLLYATKYQDINILLSNFVNEESRILYDRSPRQRVEKVAPWLTVETQAYPVVADGRLYWAVDAYTTSNNYPYSQRFSLREVTTDSLTQSRGGIQQASTINYIRNSVKAFVDAYDGTVHLYEWDEEDPLLKTWMQVYPDIVKPKSEIPEDLLQHVRYPEDMFKVQRSVLAKYHVIDPGEFYSGQDFWTIPDDPTKETITQPQPPFYQQLKMPGQPKTDFSITTTFSPNQRQTLAALMAANATPGDDYGQIRILVPENINTPGPTQVQNNFNTNTNVANELLSLKRGDTKVIMGNLLTLPIGGGFLYVEPVYAQSLSEQGYPLQRKVLMAFGERVSISDTVGEGLKEVLNVDVDPAGKPGEGLEPDNGPEDDGTPVTPVDPDDPDATVSPTPAPTDAPSDEPTDDATTDPGKSMTPEEAQAELSQALADAERAYERGQAALQKGDFAAYGKAQDELADSLERAIAAEEVLYGLP